MVKVYAIALAAGLLALVGWLVASALADANNRPALDPERRWGHWGRRVVGGAIGLGMAGLSAEYSPLGIEWPLAFVLAMAGSAAAAWWAGYWSPEA